MLRIEEHAGPSLEQERSDLRRAEAGATEYSESAQIPTVVKPSSSTPIAPDLPVRGEELSRRERLEQPFQEAEEALQQEEATGRRIRPVPKVKLGQRRKKFIEDITEEPASPPVHSLRERAEKSPRAEEYEEREIQQESPEQYSEEPLEHSGEPSQHERREGTTTTTYSAASLGAERQETTEPREQERIKPSNIQEDEEGRDVHS